MKTKSKIVRNSAITIILISVLIIIAYFLSNNSLLSSKFIFKKHFGNAEGKIIINQKYNKILEGSVLDSIFDFDATVISLEQPKVLHKEIELSNNSFSSGNIKGVNISEKDLTNSKKKNNNEKFYKHLFNVDQVEYKNLIANVTVPTDSEIADSKESYVMKTSKKENRFEGLIAEFNPTVNENKTTDEIKTDRKLIASIKNWDSTKNKPFYKLGKILHIKEPKKPKKKITTKPQNIFNHDLLVNSNLLKVNKNGSKLKLEIVKDFSSDPLQSVIKNVLTPHGLPETAANVDAIARGMGLPSGSLGSKHALAGSLGISIQDLSNPNTKLSSDIVKSITSNKDYIGKELDINNTTLGDYYTNALRSNLSSNDSSNGN